MNTISQMKIIFLAVALVAVAAQCSAAATATVEVVDPSGKPVAGATVYVFDFAHIKTPTTLTTDTSGSITADVDPLDPQTGQETICMVVAKGWAPSGGQLTPGDNKLQLLPSDTVTGKAVDSKGNPVAGVTVNIAYAINSTALYRDYQPNRFSVFMVEPLTELYKTKTDAKGAFTIANLPLGESYIVQSSLAGCVTSLSTSTKADIAAHPIVMQPGTSISGKVIRDDGKSLAGINISAQSTGAPGRPTFGSAQTAADGTYKIDGLAPATYTVRADNVSDGTGSADWLPPSPITVAAAIGQPGVAPDLVLSGGTLVTGTVVDADTKAPIANVQVGIQPSAPATQFPVSVNVRTNSNGQFTAHVWPGADSIYIYDVPTAYAKVDPGTVPGFTAVAGQPLTLDPILLKKALTVTGTVLDDAGNPIPNLSLQPQKIQFDGSMIPAATTDAKGAFTITQLMPGTFFIDPGQDWTIVSPTTFDAPATGPVNFILKKTPTAPLAGTVVDTSGAPVPGVVVAFNINHMLANQSETGTQASATSGNDGSFTIPDAPLSADMIQHYGFTKDGYVYRSGGDITSVGSKLTITPIVMAELGGSLIGIVKNGLGAVVPGAWVYSPDGADTMPIAADSSGHFSLTGLVVGQVNVFAAKGNYYTQQTALSKKGISDPSTIGLSPDPIRPVPMGLAPGKQILTDAYNQYVSAEKDHSNDWRERDTIATQLSLLDHNVAYDFLNSYAPVNSGDLNIVIPGPSSIDPAGTAVWAIPLLQRTWNNGYLGQVAAPLGLAVAPYNKAEATTLFDMAAKNVPLNNLNDENMQTASQFAALAYALGRPEADDILQKVIAGITLAKGNDKTSAFNWLGQNLVEALALGDTSVALKYLATLSKSDQLQVVPQIVTSLIKTDPTGALIMFHSLDKYKDSPDDSYAYSSALCSVLPTIFVSNPTGALQQAKAIADSGTRDEAITIVADQLPIAQAAPLYREAEKDSSDNDGQGSTPASIAAHAYLRDADLGKELFAIAYNKEIVQNGANQFGQSPIYSEFAFYYSRIDPGFSRLLLEKEFAASLQKKSYDMYPGDCVLSEVAAMSAIDIDRAKEMAAAIPDSDTRFSADVVIGEYVLADQKTRDTLAFSNWMDNGYGSIPTTGVW